MTQQGRHRRDGQRPITRRPSSSGSGGSYHVYEGGAYVEPGEHASSSSSCDSGSSSSSSSSSDSGSSSSGSCD